MPIVKSKDLTPALTPASFGRRLGCQFVKTQSGQEAEYTRGNFLGDLRERMFGSVGVLGCDIEPSRLPFNQPLSNEAVKLGGGEMPRDSSSTGRTSPISRMSRRAGFCAAAAMTSGMIQNVGDYTQAPTPRTPAEPPLSEMSALTYKVRWAGLAIRQRTVRR